MKLLRRHAKKGQDLASLLEADALTKASSVYQPPSWPKPEPQPQPQPQLQAEPEPESEPQHEYPAQAPPPEPNTTTCVNHSHIAQVLFAENASNTLLATRFLMCLAMIITFPMAGLMLFIMLFGLEIFIGPDGEFTKKL